ncbi:MAG: HDOD domain-containing protein [Acidobacteria bacterium]|nr:HDOD domain-containing protein [Acidobacteriota bacterium]
MLQVQHPQPVAQPARAAAPSGPGPALPCPHPTTPWALDNLPPFSPVALKLLNVLNDERIHVDQVSRFITAEPVFSARVLQIANSPLFALQRQVTSIPHAVIVVGLDKVKAIALTRALGDYIAPVLRRKALLVCWRNTLAGALLAEMLAPACGLDAGEAYTAGLLCDIGRLALLVKYPEAYTNVITLSGEHSHDLLTTERTLFEIDHCQAGCWIVGQMAMPAWVQEAVAHHHDEEPAAPFRLVHVVRAADRLADTLGYSILPSQEQPCFEAWMNELPPEFAARVNLDPETLRAEIERKLQAWS